METWHYLENQFDNATRTSFRLMLTVTNDHYAKVKAQQADPNIAPLYTRYEPVHEDYLRKYSNWKTAKALHKSSTLSVENLQEELSGTLARQWDAAIMVEYDKGTPEHTALLPNGRTPFQRGTRDERIAAVKTLAETLTAYVPLAALQTTVDAFYTTIRNARDAQQGNEQLKAQASTDLEVARKATAVMLYKSLGVLMDLFGNTPNDVLNYYEVSLLRSNSTATETEFTGDVPPLSTVAIVQGIDSSANLIITNTGTVPLEFCEGANDIDACSSGLIVAPGEVYEGSASDFTDPENNFFKVTNNNATTQGSYNVEIIVPA